MQLVRWDAQRREGLLEGRVEEGFRRTTGELGVVEKRSRRNSTGGRGRPFPDGEASSWGCNDRHPIARAARASSAARPTHGNRARKQQMETGESDGHHERRGEQGMREWQGSGATHVRDVQSCRMAEPKNYLLLFPALPAAFGVRLILPCPRANACESAIAAGKDWPMAAHSAVPSRFIETLSILPFDRGRPARGLDRWHAVSSLLACATVEGEIVCYIQTCIHASASLPFLCSCESHIMYIDSLLTAPERSGQQWRMEDVAAANHHLIMLRACMRP